MKVSYNWLKDYVDISDSPAELAEKLTMAGIEVEEIISTVPEFSGVIVGRVGSVKKHPNADKLSLCQVEIPGETVDVICGAPNVAEGQHVPFAPVGTTLPVGITLKKAKIRGIDSNGMICSEEELGLAEKSDGIWVLPEDWKIGLDVNVKLQETRDYIFDLAITPNRPDAMSVIGIAREIAAIYRSTFRYPEIDLNEKTEPASDYVSVDIQNPDGCPRYSARIIKDVSIQPSPDWMQDRLSKSGIRPINNIVDITNYILLELGQPLHAFDIALLKGKKIIVRDSKSGEKFVTLDEKQRQIPQQTVMICDAGQAVAIGGIMGGMNSEVSEKTTDVLLESAYFNPVRIGISSKKLGLSSEASMRFERGADPNGVIRASDRAAALMAEIGGGSVLSGVVDTYPKEIKPRKITVRTSRVNKVLGTRLKDADIRKILTPLGIFYQNEKAEIPTFRPDLEREIDLIEEVARLTGFDNIPIKENTVIDYDTEINRNDLFYDFLKGEIRELGFTEIITNSMVAARELSRIEETAPVAIMNPVSDDMNVLRRSLIPGLLKTAVYNINRNSTDLRLFEMGRIFLGTDPDDAEQQPYHLAGLLHGSQQMPGWSAERLPIDFYDVKGYCEAFLGKIFLDNLEFILYDNNAYFEPSEVTAVKKNGRILGRFGKVRGTVCDIFDLDLQVYAFEFSVPGIQMFFDYKRLYRPYSRYPFVEKDVAFIIANDVHAEDIRRYILNSAKALLQRVEIFDVYSGDRLPEGEKSIAFRLRFQSDSKTLQDAEVNRIFDQIIGSINSKFNARLREG